MQKLKQGDIVTINRRKYTVLKEKGDMYYLCPTSERMNKNLYLWFPNGNHLIKTDAPSSVFRLPQGKKRNAAVLKEIEIRDDHVFIFGMRFEINKSRLPQDYSTLCIEIKGHTVFLNIQYMSLTLESVIAA